MKKLKVGLCFSLLLAAGLLGPMALGEQASGRFNIPAKKLYALVVKKVKQNAEIFKKFHGSPDKILLDEDNLSLRFSNFCGEGHQVLEKCILFYVIVVPDSATTSTLQVEAVPETEKDPAKNGSSAEQFLTSIREYLLHEKFPNNEP